MKRRSIQGSKRRDRRSGMSPYARHSKREYIYSPALRQWQRQHVSAEQASRHNTRQG